LNIDQIFCLWRKLHRTCKVEKKILIFKYIENLKIYISMDMNMAMTADWVMFVLNLGNFKWLYNQSSGVMKTVDV